MLPLGVLLENLGVYAALIAGAEVTLLPLDKLGMSGASGVDLKRLLSCILLSGAQSLILVPQLLLGLVTAIERGLTQVGALRFVAVGGARVSASLLARAQAIGLPVFEGYGLSECASVVCLNRPEANRPGTVGRPLPHVEVRLAEDGEVLVRGSTLLGYLGEPPPEPAWWPTGDLGHFDADGYLHILGRKKNQFITSLGRNVNPEWVEAELTQDGTILQAYVQGRGSPTTWRCSGRCRRRRPTRSWRRPCSAATARCPTTPGCTAGCGWPNPSHPPTACSPVTAGRVAKRSTSVTRPFSTNSPTNEAHHVFLRLAASRNA